MRVFGLVTFSIAVLLGAVLASPTLNDDILPPSALAGTQRALVVLAHADDEVMNAGLLHHLARTGSAVHLVTLTDGAANPKSDLGACEESDIRACRAREVRASAARLGVAEVALAQLPDSSLADHEAEALAHVRREMARFRPDALLTVEPSGLNGNADHVAAHRIAVRALLEAVAQAGTPEKGSLGNLAGVERLVLTTLPFPISVFLPTRFPDDLGVAPRHFLLDDSLIKAKTDAAALHASQASTLSRLSGGIGPEALFRWAGRESFYVLEGAPLRTFLERAREGNMRRE